MIKSVQGVKTNPPKTEIAGGWARHIAFPVLLVCTVGATDYLTGWEMSFGLFYLIPVGIVAWLQRKLNTFIIVGMSALMWMTVDLAVDTSIQYM